MHRIIACVILASLASFVNSARILGIVATPSYSHQVVFHPIWRELSLRGHKVTVITTHPLDDPKLTNLTELNMKFVNPLLEQKFKFSETLDTLKDDSVKFAKFFIQTMSAAQEEQFAHPDVQRLIKDESVEFDLVMAEFLLPTGLAFAHRFKCPLIALTSLDASIPGHDSIGNPSHPVLNPDSLLKFTGKLTFLQRVFSTLYSIIRRVSFIYVADVEDQVVARQFGEGYPPLREIVDKNIDMFFMNVNLAFHNIRPTVPAVVQIGGAINIEKEKPLPEDIKKFLDNSKKGAIFFSLGTNVRTKSIPKKFLDAILSALGDIPYNVLWKLDVEDVPGKPDNVLIKKWVPQHDVLRHPNVKLFISQCGMQSTDEAIYFAMPMLGIPFLADQFSNAIQIENKGFGIALDRHTIDKDSLKAAIMEVIGNPIYKEKAQQVSNIVKDQPMTGLEKAVWWTEYVLRHKGAKHLRSPSTDMPIYQYLLLDVIAFLSAIVFAVAFVLYKATKFAACCLCKVLGKKCASKSKEKTKVVDSKLGAKTKKNN